MDCNQDVFVGEPLVPGVPMLASDEGSANGVGVTVDILVTVDTEVLGLEEATGLGVAVSTDWIRVMSVALSPLARREQ